MIFLAIKPTLVFSIVPKAKKYVFSPIHGGKSKGTTCVVDRDVTAYLVVDRVLRIPTEQYGCRYVGYPGFNDVKVIFRHILLFYFQNLFLGYFSILRKA